MAIPREQLRSAVNDVTAISTDHVGRGWLKFGEVIPREEAEHTMREIEFAQDCARALLARIDRIPEAGLKPLVAVLREAAAAFQALTNPPPHNANADPMDVINPARAAVNKLMDSSAAMLAADAVNRHPTEAADAGEAAVATITSAQKIAIDAIDATVTPGKLALEEAIGRSTDAIARLEAIESRVAGEVIARDFGERAKAHETAVRRFLIASVLLAGAALAAILCWPVHPLTYTQASRGIAAAPQYLDFAAGALRHVGVLLLLVYGLVWCTRNYRAHKHNELLDRQRQLTLSTWESFARGASENTRSAIQFHAASAAFASQPTGFQPMEPEPMPMSPAIDLLRQLSSKEKPPAV